MDLNRYTLLMIGLVVLFLGIQLRMVDTYVLNDEATQFVRSRVKRVDAQTAVAARSLFPGASPIPLQTIQPPKWLGWAMISVGSVLVLHSLVMRKEGG